MTTTSLNSKVKRSSAGLILGLTIALIGDPRCPASQPATTPPPGKDPDSLKDKIEQRVKKYEKDLSEIPVGLSAEELRRLEKRVKANPKLEEERVELLRHYFFAQDGKKVEQHAVKMAMLHPENREYLYYVHVGVPSAGNPLARRLIQIYERKLKESKPTPELLLNAARCYEATDFRRREELLKQALAIAPENTEVLHDLAHFYTLNGRSKEAVPLYLSLLKLTETTYRASVAADLAEAAYRAQDWENAGRYAKEAVDLDKVSYDPKTCATNEAYTILGLVALRKGNHAEAKECLLLSADVNPCPHNNSFGLEMELVEALIAIKELEVARVYLNAALTFTPQNQRAQDLLKTLDQ